MNLCSVAGRAVVIILDKTFIWQLPRQTAIGRHGERAKKIRQ